MTIYGSVMDEINSRGIDCVPMSPHVQEVRMDAIRQTEEAGYRRRAAGGKVRQTDRCRTAAEETSDSRYGNQKKNTGTGIGQTYAGGTGARGKKTAGAEEWKQEAGKRPAVQTQKTEESDH